jgi:hypothetical protein
MRSIRIKSIRDYWRKTAVVSMAMVLLVSLTVVPGVFAEEKRIRILHVNDFRGFAEPYKPLGSQELLGGAAYLSTAVNRLRKSRWCGASFPFKPHLPIATYK